MGLKPAALLPDWATAALNGTSMRVPKPWHIDELEPGDVLAGTVTVRGKGILTVAVESGTLAGQPLEVGEWRHVMLHCGLLRAWVKRDDPQPGTRVVISYLGRTGHGPRRRFDYACGVFRPQPWE